MKPLVDQAYQATHDEYDEIKKTQPTAKEPQYVVFWGAVAQELYANESEEVKKRVEEAVKEQENRARMLRDGQLFEGDPDTKLLRLEA